MQSVPGFDGADGGAPGEKEAATNPPMHQMWRDKSKQGRCVLSSVRQHRCDHCDHERAMIFTGSRKRVCRLHLQFQPGTLSSKPRFPRGPTQVNIINHRVSLECHKKPHHLGHLFRGHEDRHVQIRTGLAHQVRRHAPGQIVCTRILSFCTSCARTFDQPITACFDAP